MKIADTSGLISLLVKTDSNYLTAKDATTEQEKNFETIIVPAEIFSEFVNVLGKKFGHESTTNAIHEILNSKLFMIQESSDVIRGKALEKFSQQPNSVSFTDCIVMAVADELHTKEIFGFDEAFHKNGYIRLGLDK